MQYDKISINLQEKKSNNDFFFLLHGFQNYTYILKKINGIVDCEGLGKLIPKTPNSIEWNVCDLSSFFASSI